MLDSYERLQKIDQSLNEFIEFDGDKILKNIIDAGIHCVPAITDSYFASDPIVYSTPFSKVSALELRYMRKTGYVSWFAIDCKGKMFDCKLTLKSWRLLN